MSFLPYAKPPASILAASITGSSALHFGLVGLLLTSSVALLPAPTRNETRAPDFEITLEILDANIIDLTEPEPENALVPPDAVPLEPDAAQADLLEETQLAALAPAENIDTGPDALDTLDGGLEPLVDGADDLLQPSEDTSAQVDETAVPDALPEPAQTEPDDVQPLAPVELPDPDIMAINDISPIDSGEISPFAVPVAPAEITQPTLTQTDVATLAPDDTSQDQIVALVLPEDTAPPTDPVETVLPNVLPPDDAPEPEIVEPAVIAPEPDTEPDPETAENPQDTPAAVASPDAPRALENPDPQTVMIGTLIQRIRATPSPQCTLALPRDAGPDGVGVSFVGAQEAGLDTFAGRLLDGLSPVPIQTREIIDGRQCALLDAVRQVADYPAGRIGLALDDTTLRSGENLRGRVTGAGGLFVTLVLIDDNGVVQDMSRFTTIEGNDPVFDAPVARSGPTRATRQIILALGSDVAPIDISGQIGQEAEAVFSALPADVLRSAKFGLATFDVR